MLKVENVETWGFRNAIRGMRNPMNSWSKSDSYGYLFGTNEDSKEIGFEVGSNDIELMKKLISAGTEHRKFLRMIHAQMDVVAPLYWWKEYDTYKVGTVANSCSTMHKIAAKEFTLGDFSHEHLLSGNDLHEEAYTPIKMADGTDLYSPTGVLMLTCKVLNKYRELYLVTKDKKYWWQMIQLLPSSYNQRRTVDFNYETAISMIRQRTGHKLEEWHVFINELMKLPCMEEFVKCLNK